jgi:hypothetical protein
VSPDAVQSDVFSDPVAIPDDARVHLRVEVDYERLFFAFRGEAENGSGCPAPGRQYFVGRGGSSGATGFTGAFVEDVLPGPFRNAPSGEFRLLRILRPRVSADPKMKVLPQAPRVVHR